MFGVSRRKIERTEILRNKSHISNLPAENRTDVLTACVRPVPMNATTAGILDGRLAPEASSETSETRHEERVAKATGLVT